MAIIGYARTSTRDQEAGLQAQIRDLIAAGCAERDIYPSRPRVSASGPSSTCCAGASCAPAMTSS